MYPEQSRKKSLYNLNKAILKKMLVGGNISDKKVNRKEFLFFLSNTFKYSANVVLTNI